MRLLNVRTRKLEEFLGPPTPNYAILSHRWGIKEITFQELNAFESEDWGYTTTDKNSDKGLSKIVYACVQAAKDGLEYVWVDTCCIDKTSSVELSEAINSMYAWYHTSDICYAYLDDVNATFSTMKTAAGQAAFAGSKWFTRGWTLQELLAPSKLIFFGIDWSFLGHRAELSELVSKRTRIPGEVLKEPLKMQFASIASRMSWAAGRETTRVEDAAYSLLGIFNVNIPLLYGEGKKAFIRLQEEILKESDDQSIFAWEFVTGDCPDGYLFTGPLADSPANFAQSGNIIPLPSDANKHPYTMTNKGLRIEPLIIGASSQAPVAILDCHYDNDFSGVLGIKLRATDVPSIYMRMPGQELKLCRASQVKAAQLQTIYLAKNHPLKHTPRSYETCILTSESTHNYGFRVQEVAPKEFPWNEKTQTIKMLRETAGNMVAFKFCNSQWDNAPVVVFALTSTGDKGLLKIVENQGDECLQQLLEREAKSTRFFSRHSLLLPPHRNSTDRSTKLILEASVKKDKIFGQKVFLLEVGIRTNL